MSQTSQTVQTKHTYIEYKKYLYILITAILITDLTILLNIPYLRQILGFLFLTILPGLLILQIFKLNKLKFTEKFVLLVGLSISFLMFFGLLINNLSFSLGYATPLSTISLLISFNLAFIVFAIVGCKTNKTTIFSLPNLELGTSEKAFLIVPILFPALTIFGMHVMNTTDNNIILMFLLLLIPAYVVFVCLFNHKFSERLYPAVIFLISISLLLLLALRSNHIIGADTHQEYYIFQTTLDNLHWSIFEYSTLDACLAISLLPTIYQSILNIPSEFLFKILYSALYSISPLAIYVLSKKYIGESYGFLASCFFMFQLIFLATETNSRTCIAVLFFMLAMMVLFSDKIDPLKKRALFIVFMASCMVSHYSTTYIFFFIMIGTFIGLEILLKKFTFKKMISLTTMVLFFAMIFFWYSQVTETAFNAGVSYIENTLTELNRFFIMESRDSSVQEMVGKDIMEKSIPQQLEFVFSWLTVALIGIGVVTLIRRYRNMSFPELGFKKPEFLKDKFEVGYFMIALVCSGLLVTVVALPYASAHYGMARLYSVAITILSVFFVIGGIIVAKYLNKLLPVLRGKASTKNAPQVLAYLIILLVLIPYFFCVTGVTYQMFGVPQTIILNSEGEYYDKFFVHDQESSGAKWLKSNADERVGIYAVGYSNMRLLSQGGIHSSYATFIEDKKVIKKGYIYLRYYDVVDGKLLRRGRITDNMTEYSDIFNEISEVYANGGSEIWKN